jgi:hypothetical protein
MVKSCCLEVEAEAPLELCCGADEQETTSKASTAPTSTPALTGSHFLHIGGPSRWMLSIVLHPAVHDQIFS